MNVSINVDCTPEEARTFLGLPDMTSLQDDMMAKMREQMTNAAGSINPEQMMKTIFPEGTGDLADMQKKFWSALAGSSLSGASEKNE